MLFAASGQRPWMQEYTQVPLPVLLDDKCRIFFTTRHYPNADKLPISMIGYIDTDRNDLSKTLGISKDPVLKLGGYGTFDEF